MSFYPHTRPSKMLSRQSNSSSILTVSPTFSSYSSTRFAEIASRVVDEVNRENEEEEIEENEEDFLFSGTVDHLKRMALDPLNEEEEHEEEIALEPSQRATAAVENAGEGEEEEEGEDDDFEFAFVPRDLEAPPLNADDMFANGQIRPIWPIFNQDLIFSESNESDRNSKEQSRAPSIRLPMRKLLTEERSRPSSESSALDGIPAGSYCVWRPKAQRSARPESASASASSSSAAPGGCKKSNSTGSSKVWRFRDLMHRSSSNGQDTMVFLSTDAIKGGERKGKAAAAGGKKGEKKREVSAHEIYLRNRMMSEGDRRRSFLPYRQDLVGFFANVNGLSRSLHPF
ncbi:hypothetical protein ACLOJK_001408 [Asimina triloba]